MRAFLKKARLVMNWWIKVLYRWLKKSLAYIPAIFSVTLLLLILATNLAHRAPILGYFIEELELPLTLFLSGRVVNLTDDGTICSVRAAVNIGGYQTKTDINGNFRIRFSSPMKGDIPVVITFTYANTKKTILRYISFPEKNYTVQEDFFVTDIFSPNDYRF